MRARTSLAGAALLAMLGGCAVYTTPSGPRSGTSLLSWTFPGETSADPFAQGVPPGTLGQPVIAEHPAPDLSGTYSGRATVVFNPGEANDCTDLAINSSLMVRGRQARLLRFTGTVAPDGQVVMQAGDSWISGRFIGRRFDGELLRRFPACAWTLALTADK